MRAASVAGWLFALCAISISAAPGTQKGRSAGSVEEAITGETPADDDEAAGNTIFNGLEVPPMIEIEGDKFADTVKDGYW
jgi:hypothetical protein